MLRGRSPRRGARARVPVRAASLTAHLTPHADLAEHPAVILLVGVVPLVIVTYLQAKGSIGMGMKVKDT
jgi:hypothetical protein